MKIYFACSIAGGRDYDHLYGDILEAIKASGANVLSELFADKELKPEVGMNLDTAFVWKRDEGWVREADAIIAEVTQPSLGVGYELGLAEQLHTPVLALFYEKSGRRLSPMVDGNPNFVICRYSKLNEAKATINDFINKL